MSKIYNTWYLISLGFHPVTLNRLIHSQCLKHPGGRQTRGDLVGLSTEGEWGGYVVE